MTPKKNILILNGSIRGKRGNSRKIAKIAREKLKITGSINSSILNLSEQSDANDLHKLLLKADGFLVVTGTLLEQLGLSSPKFHRDSNSF